MYVGNVLEYIISGKKGVGCIPPSESAQCKPAFTQTLALTTLLSTLKKHLYFPQGKTIAFSALKRDNKS
jgi:hypothetical protein